jgi:hypothetical protein
MLEFNFKKYARCWNLLKFLLGQTSFSHRYSIPSFFSHYQIYLFLSVNLSLLEFP